MATLSKSLSKLAASHISWRERLSIDESEADEWDELFEALDEGTGEGVRTVTRTPTPMPNFQRHNAGRKVAATQNWDSEVADIKSHVASVLSKLGNG